MALHNKRRKTTKSRNLQKTISCKRYNFHLVSHMTKSHIHL